MEDRHWLMLVGETITRDNPMGFPKDDERNKRLID